MTSIIVVTSSRERDETIRNAKAKLKEIYLTDASVTVVQTNISTIKLYQLVNQTQVLMGVYRFIVIPVTLSFEQLEGVDPSVNININKLLIRIDSLKQEVQRFTDTRKIRNKRKLKDFKLMVNRSFGE